MPALRIKNEEGTWDKVPMMGSYKAVVLANAAKDEAVAAANNGDSVH